MRIEYQYTRQDYIEALRVFKNLPASRKRMRSMLLYLVGFIVGFYLLITVTTSLIELLIPTAPVPVPKMPAPPSSVRDIWLAGLPWLCVIVVLIPLVKIMTWRVRESLWRDSQHLHRPTWLEADERGLRCGDAIRTTDYRWDAFTSMREAKNVFVLTLSDLAFLFIPKRAFAGHEQLAEFRQLIQTNIPTRTHAFPVLPGPPPVLPTTNK